MTKGYFRTGKRGCNFCGERDEEIRRFKHPSGDYTFICKKCAIRNSWNWEKGEPVKAQGAPPAPSFSYLHKIYSIKKQFQVFDILQAIHPTHSERLFLAGFLKYTGHSYDETLKIIDEHGQWEDYDPSITVYQLATVYKQPHRTSSNTGSKRRARKWELLPTEEYRIKLVRSAESHRELQRWMQENGVPIYDAAPELEFDAAKLGRLEK